MYINDELKYGTNRTKHMIANDPCPQCAIDYAGNERLCAKTGEVCNCCDHCHEFCAEASPVPEFEDFASQVRHCRTLPTSELVQDLTNPVEFTLRERLLDAELRLKQPV